MMMRFRQYRLSTLVALVTAAAIGMAVYASLERPSITAVQTKIDVGALAPGASGTSTFKLRNSGSDPIHVMIGAAM